MPVSFIIALLVIWAIPPAYLATPPLISPETEDVMRRSGIQSPKYKLLALVFETSKDALVMACDEKMAERTGLEPATPGVTGRYSNQLNYRSR